MDTYEGKVNWVYRHFPLSFHEPLATQKAEASELQKIQKINNIKKKAQLEKIDKKFESIIKRLDNEQKRAKTDIKIKTPLMIFLDDFIL